jgi:hypothetical protein
MTKEEKLLKKVEKTSAGEICLILAQKEYDFIKSEATKEIDHVMLLREKYEKMPIGLLKDLYLGNLCLGSKKFVTWESGEDEGDW